MNAKNCEKCGTEVAAEAVTCECGNDTFAADISATASTASHESIGQADSRNNTVNYLLWFFAACAAVVVALSLSNNASTSDGASAASAAISNFQTNDASSTTVYQQQVNAQWATKDLLKVIADQNATMIRNQAVLVRSLEFATLLLGLLVVVLVRTAVRSQGKPHRD